MVDATTGNVYSNTGTSASPSWTLLNPVAATNPVVGINTTAVTIADTGDTDVYLLAPYSGTIAGLDFSCSDALTADDLAYVTWTAINSGQDASGTALILANDPLNSTEMTPGGISIIAHSKVSFVLTATAGDLAVVQGDRIRIRAAVTGTIVPALAGSIYMLRITPA